MEILVEKLNERIKELRCIYQVEELLTDPGQDLEPVFLRLLDIIPAGWQHTTICEACITYEEKEYVRPDFVRTPWFQEADLVVDNTMVGNIRVHYIQKIDKTGGMLFLPEEQKLLDAIADRLSHFLFSRRLKNTLEYMESPYRRPAKGKKLLSDKPDVHWRWRYRMARVLAGHIDMERFGVKAVYLIGSTREAKAGAQSDIDLLVHVDGSEHQQAELNAWMEGWGLCLAEFNYLKTAEPVKNGLIDLHLITDEDIRNNTSYAVMIKPGSRNAHLLRKKE
ncbi:MAG: nucleotidyltransferase domain-containing protein [Bacteroidales bacterium]